MPQFSRLPVGFQSGGSHCAAWHYPGDNGACIVMAPGGGVTKEPGTDRFAARFQEAGFSVLAFDFRHFGGSEGRPRQVIRPRAQLEDLKAAIDYAATLPEVVPNRIAAWGFSLAGGHVMRLAASVKLAAAIAQTPFVDGFASTPNALRHETVSVVLRFPFIALSDVLRTAAGRSPRLIPLAGPRGTVAMLTTPDAVDGGRALDPNGRYEGWSQQVAARSALRLGTYRPGQAASKVRCPLLVVVAAGDQSVLAAPAQRAAERAPDATVLTVPGGHYAPFLEQHDEVVDAEIAFLANHLLEPPKGAPRDPNSTAGEDVSRT